MADKPKISVIVAAYNIELYIGKCIDSLANQDYENLEILIINDGSTDRTEDVINKKIEQYSERNIILCNKENGGLSDARNYGIEKATGDYISFIDGDDYVEKDMYLEMAKKLNEFSYDIVACDVNCKYPNKELLIDCGIKESKESLTIDDRKKLIKDAYVVVWNKIYNKKLFKTKETFMKGIWFEDVLFSYKLFPLVESVGVVHKPFCNYIQRTSSITYTYNEKLYDITKVMDELKKYYEKEKLYEYYEDILEYQYVRYLFGTLIKRMAKSKDKKRFNEAVEYAITKVKENYPNYKKNRFLKNGKKEFYLRNFNKFFANIIYISEKNKMN